MSDEMPPPPFVYEGLDPVPEPKSAIAEVSEAVKGTAHRVGDAIMLVENRHAIEHLGQHSAESYVSGADSAFQAVISRTLMAAFSLRTPVARRFL
jgi:hypothetical protein